MDNKKFERSFIAGMAIVIVILVGYTIYHVLNNDEATFGVVAILILTGLGAFIGLMNFLSTTAKWLGMIDTGQPFGLPEGTVRAILTIAFIVLVGVLASYLLTATGNRQQFAAEIPVQTGVAADIAQAAVTRLSADGLVIVKPNDKDATKFDVALRPRQDYRLADDIAKQILTILSTILAAMIGFYFGARPGDANAARADASERATLLADLNRRVQQPPTVQSVREAAAAKEAALTEQPKKDRVAKIKASLDDTDKKVAAAQSAIGDLSVPIEKVRAACGEATGALGKLADLKKELDAIS